jgi:hypothetical protein
LSTGKDSVAKVLKGSRTSGLISSLFHIYVFQKQERQEPVIAKGGGGGGGGEEEEEEEEEDDDDFRFCCLYTLSLFFSSLPYS